MNNTAVRIPNELAVDDLKSPLGQFAQTYSLSKRELDVLNLLVQQVVSAEDISDKLGISRNTVRIHLKNINTKVGTNSKSELLGRFIEFVIQNKKSEEKLSTQRLTILIADDDQSYVDLVRKASESVIGADVTFQHAADGQLMMDYLGRVKRNDGSTARPHLILLDLNMPKLNGFQALEKIKTDPMLSEIPVVVFSSSSTPSDISSIYALGGNSYVTKPGGYQELKKVIHGIVFYWGQIGALPIGK
jgi:DNA-binding NarL/FixJ family response regulator